MYLDKIKRALKHQDPAGHLMSTTCHPATEIQVIKSFTKTEGRLSVAKRAHK